MIERVIYQGDQYLIPVRLMFGGEIATPDLVDDVILRFGPFEESYSSGAVKFENERWLFPLTKEMSNTFQTSVKFQAEIIVEGQHLHSRTDTVTVGFSIIK